MKDIQYTIFILYPAEASAEQLAMASPNFAKILGDSRMVDGNADFQFPKTRAFEGKKISGKVMRALPVMLQAVITTEGLPLEIVGAQDFDYTRTVETDPETEEETIVETGKCEIPMSRALWRNFMADEADKTQIEDLENPIMVRPDVPEIGPKSVDGATPMFLID